MMNEYEKRSLYRSRRGIFFGVCRGLAEYFDISVFWTRVITAGACIFTGFWPVGAAYLLAALILKREPGFGAFTFWRRAARTQEGSARAYRRTTGSLDARLQRLEAAMRQDANPWNEML